MHCLKESIFTSEAQFQLAANAASLTALGKGILAADESPQTIGKRFKEFSISNDVETRRAYRELLFSSGAELGHYISGVILHEETVDQKTSNGKSLVSLLEENNILPGVKLDKGLRETSWSSGGEDGNVETCVNGLDGLEERCKAFYQKGIRFAKWRSVFKITDSTPSEVTIQANVIQLAQYASVCQANGLVPIVEPEILMDGNHDLRTCMRWQSKILSELIHALNAYSVLLEGTLLKTNFVLPGIDCQKQEEEGEIVKATISVLCRTIPPALGGIVFLSGGLSEERATCLLNAVNRTQVTKPWALSFSFGRALQHSVLEKWANKQDSVLQAQACLIHRAKLNSLACTGTLLPSEEEKEKMHHESSKKQMHEANYVY